MTYCEVLVSVVILGGTVLRYSSGNVDVPGKTWVGKEKKEGRRYIGDARVKSTPRESRRIGDKIDVAWSRFFVI